MRPPNSAESSLAGLRQLNTLGYGWPGSGLILNLVYNPLGAVLPPDQIGLEAAYQHELATRYGIVFNHLLALAKMPIQRFGSQLISKGQFKPYMDLLKSAHRDEWADTEVLTGSHGYPMVEINRRKPHGRQISG
jgi:hypothetical protein